MFNEIDEFLQVETVVTEKILKFGSLVGILHNKDITVVTLFNILLGDPALREQFCMYMRMNIPEYVTELAKRYSILSTSKKIGKIVYDPEEED